MRVCFLLVSMLLPIVAHAQQEPDLGTEEQRAAGRALYMDKCAQCHGEEGQGDGIAEAYFRPVPRDFTSGIYKVRTTPSGQLPTDEDLKRVIANGMPYTGMPAWPSLSNREITNLVYFIKTFNQDFSGPYGVPDVVEIPSPPSVSDESIARGRDVYVENQCSDCHGQQGRGDGPSAPTLQDQWDNHIRPADLTKRWTFIGGTSRQDIYRTFTTGLDGSPMPSYTIEPIEDRWALVDYVHSLSQDEPNYGTVIVARGIDEPIDVSQGEAIFRESRRALFPVVGQVIEPGRVFMPGIDAIEARAVYNSDEIAIMLRWHDMRAEIGPGRSNSPSMEVPRTEGVVRDTSSNPYSDAVAVQIPSELSSGVEKPYFLFGDERRSVDLWFADLATDSVQSLVARGSGDITAAENDLDFMATYEDGEWTAVFKRARMKEGGMEFNGGEFVPIAFSVWDGFNQERGNRRGITSWYHVYLEPLDRPSALIPMLKWGGLTLLLQIAIVAIVRRRNRKVVSA
jgi:mono/diheme cytochrome c family protein